MNSNKETRPWFKFWVHDYLHTEGVLDLDTEAIGPFVLLLGYQWTQDGLDPDLKGLARRARLSYRQFKVHWEGGLSELFPEAPDGRLRNPRLEQDRKKQAEAQATQRHRAEFRWAKQRKEIPEEMKMEEWLRLKA